MSEAFLKRALKKHLTSLGFKVNMERIKLETVKLMEKPKTFKDGVYGL